MEERKRRIITWDNVINYADIIGGQIDKTEINSIYGIARGGLVLAVLLSHRLQLPIVEKDGINLRTLIVDDISDSGETLLEFEKGFKVKYGNLNLQYENKLNTAVLFQRNGTKYKANYVGEKITNNDWLIFPWEI